MISVPTGDPVVCRGVDKGRVEKPGVWLVTGGGVPLEVPGDVFVVGFPGDTEKLELDTESELLETTVEGLSVVCEGVARGW